MYKNILKSEILFTGYYGQQNTGDDAFLEVASWGAEKYWHKSNSIFLSRKKGLPVLCKDIRGYPLSIPKTYRLQEKLLLSSTDYLISAGGSTMSRELQADNIKRLAIERKKKNSKIRIGGIGVSIGPFKTIKDEKSTVEYLKNIDFLAVRDQASFDFLTSLDLPYKPVNAFDLAALLPEIYGVQKKELLLNNKKVVGISVCPFESIVDDNKIENEYKRNAKIISLLKILNKKEDIHFKFFIINGNPIVGDLQLTRETIGKVSPNSYEIINYNKETRATWNEISSCDFIISTRLHAAIFACFSDTPFMLNEYHRKCGDFLDNIDYDESLRLFDSEYNPTEKANTIINILNDQSNYIYPKKICEMKKKSELNFTGVII
ncbi:polysaccharide pyruvyl transferase family protein [Psychrobacter sp. 72-O-c]|uniref:polysaccharide pyruvyl transferase family protein n=1 Tax=Psychrobacter sp. 72-O-c TaxID=2774125 RepID=UPI00191B1773|nr:polysaccharide pyruvyl transferase family protein [Psychrobacter sp. 72-O-c]